MSSVPRVCAACGAPSAWDARFCQQCGRPLAEAPNAPRYYGALSPGPAFVLGCLLLGVAVIALLAGRALVATALVAVAILMFVFFYGAAKRNPESPLTRRVVVSGYRLRGSTRMALASIAAWSRAARDVVRLRWQTRSLRREREPVVRSLGDAVYREDEPLVTTLRERVREIDDELAKRKEERAEALAVARRHVDHEREAARATERLSVDEIASAGDDSR
jgi:hypothetical protein